MLYPTLFIGLGTTGLDILKRLEELVLEHYSIPSLDIFKYIAIETREAAEVKRSEWGESKIQLLKPVIKNTDAIKNAIDSGQKSYLRDWLDMNLLKISGSSFTDGASNIRMAGRLILWENWESIKKALNNARNQITSDENKKTTEKFLKNHYAKLKQPIDNTQPLVGDIPNVYIVGTFCGGTCSGMFIDIAYYIKHITGLWARNLPNPNLAKVIGAFTVFDSAALTAAQQEGVKIHAANSWADLIEDDFWCHPDTRYEITLPDETKISTNERPIDWLYLLSCTATDSTNVLQSNFRKASGSPDTESLNHMVAMILFTETVGAVLGKKEEIRTDYRGRSRASEPNVDEHSPCITTCGIATVWYPKYRIALGATCKYGASLCKEWLEEVDPNTQQIIEREAGPGWNGILSLRVDELTSSSTGNILGDAKQDLDKKRDNLLSLPLSQFKESLQNILSSLNKGGKYDNHLSDPGRGSNFKEELRKDIFDSIKESIDTKNLAYAEYCLKELDKAIADIIERLPEEYPTPDLNRMEEVSDDIFATLVFKSKDVENQRKREILDDCQGYIINQIKKIRNFRMRPYLEEIREEVGVGKQLSEEKTKAEFWTVNKHIQNMKKSLRECISALEKRYEDLSKDLTYTQDVKVILRGVHGAIKDDVDQLVAQLIQGLSSAQKQVILDNIIKGQTLSQFFGLQEKASTAESIKERIIEELIMVTMKRVQAFDVINHVLNNWRPVEICNFAKNGLPHLELTPGNKGLASVVIGSPVSFVTGKNQQELNELLGKLSGTPCEELFQLPLPSPELSHMLVFYREEPLMYMDENLAIASLFKECYENPEESSRYGLHTHKGGTNIFDPRIFARRDKTKNELMPIAFKILSIRDEKENWISSEVFGVEKGRLILRGARKSGLKFRLTGDDNGAKLCAQEEEIYEYFRNLVEDKLDKLSKDNLTKRINNYLEWVEQKAEREEENPDLVIEKERKNIMEIKMIKKKMSIKEKKSPLKKKKK